MTNPTPDGPAADDAETPATAQRWVRPPRRSPRPMRYNAPAAKQPGPDDPRGADVLAATVDAEEPSAEDYGTGAPILAQQAAEAGYGTVDDSADADDTQDQPSNALDSSDEPANFADAFSPAPKEEPADRDDRYRARLRDSESENERLRGTIEAIQKTEIARLASARFADPADIYRDGATVADMCSEDGTVDATKFSSTADAVLAAHPHWHKPAAPYRGPLRSGATSVKVHRPSPKFADAFSPTPNDD